VNVGIPRVKRIGEGRKSRYKTWGELRNGKGRRKAEIFSGRRRYASPRKIGGPSQREDGRRVRDRGPVEEEYRDFVQAITATRFGLPEKGGGGLFQAVVARIQKSLIRRRERFKQPTRGGMAVIILVHRKPQNIGDGHKTRRNKKVKSSDAALVEVEKEGLSRR